MIRSPEVQEQLGESLIIRPQILRNSVRPLVQVDHFVLETCESAANDARFERFYCKRPRRFAVRTHQVFPGKICAASCQPPQEAVKQMIDLADLADCDRTRVTVLGGGTKHDGSNTRINDGTVEG